MDEVVLKIRGSDQQKMYYLEDVNYNVVGLANATGTVVERCWYEPYATITITDAAGANPSSTSSQDNTFSFQGRRLDSDTGLYYFRNRYYSPRLGRFLQRDPISGGTYAIEGEHALEVVHAQRPDQDAHSLYEYGKSQPVCGVDPYGLSWSCCLQWQPMWVTRGYDHPICCMRAIIGGTWWGKPIGGVTLGAGTLVGGAVVGGVKSVALGGAPVIGAGLGIGIALETCMDYECTENVGALRVVLKKGWIWDTVRYSCPQGNLYKFGQRFSTPPNPSTGTETKTVWE